MPELILAKLDHISMILKLDSLFREIQRILTHRMRDFKGFFQLTSNYSYVFARLRLVIPTPPPLWHSQRAATKYVGYWVGPSRKCILIGITWLNKHFYFYTYFKRKLLFHLAFSANFIYIFCRQEHNFVRFGCFDSGTSEDVQ